MKFSATPRQTSSRGFAPVRLQAASCKQALATPIASCVAKNRNHYPVDRPNEDLAFDTLQNGPAILVARLTALVLLSGALAAVPGINSDEFQQSLAGGLRCATFRALAPDKCRTRSLRAAA